MFIAFVLAVALADAGHYWTALLMLIFCLAFLVVSIVHLFKR